MIKKSKAKRKLPRIAVKTEKAMKEAVMEAIVDHARTGDPMAIWQKGKVVWVPAKKLLVREPSARYRRSRKKP